MSAKEKIIFDKKNPERGKTAKVIVELLEKRRFKSTVRGLEVISGLPERMGGDNAGPSPTEMFMISFGGSVCLFCGRFLERNGLSTEGMTVEIDWAYTSKPPHHRVQELVCKINVPNADLGSKLKAFMATAQRNTVHNTMKHPPDIIYEINSGSEKEQFSKNQKGPKQ